MVNNNISYKRRYDLENEFISSIWVQVNITKNINLLVCSFYRQWQLPSNIRDTYNGDLCNQINRYKLFNEQISKANKLNKNIIILMDDNINTLEDNSSSNITRNYDHILTVL